MEKKKISIACFIISYVLASDYVENCKFFLCVQYLLKKTVI